MSANTQHPDAPLLVVERIHRQPLNPRHVVAHVRLGGHPVEVIVDLSRPDFVEFVRMPWLLGLHLPSERAVLDVIIAVDKGMPIQFPVDLSASIRDSTPPSPFQPRPAKERETLEAAADMVRVDVSDIERTSADPPHITARLHVNGKPLTAHVEVYAGPGRVPIMRWIRGTNLDALSLVERYAIERMLMRRLDG